MNEKYSMFKNFLHNELGISRDDIQDWIREAVREEARKIVQKTYDDFDVKKEFRNAITTPYSPIRKDIVDTAVRELLNKFELSLKVKE